MTPNSVPPAPGQPFSQPSDQPFSQPFRQPAAYASCGSRLTRYARALGVALILFGIFAHDRFSFFWAGVILEAVAGLL